MSTVTTKQGLIIPSHQYGEDISGLKHEYIFIPSTNVPTWGGYYVFDLREKNVILHSLAIQYNVGAISGLTPATVAGTTSTPYYPQFNPAIFWHTRIELLMNGQVIDTRYPGEQFYHQNLFQRDEDRGKVNFAMGSYKDSYNRYQLAQGNSSNNSYFYVDLWTLFDQAHIPLLFQSTDVQIRLYMDTLANQLNKGGSQTGTAACTFSGANLIATVTRLHPQHATHMTNKIMRNPHHYLFTEIRYGYFSVASGTSQTQQYVLNSITGPVSYLFFTVRKTTDVVNDGEDNSLASIASFSILDSASTNIVGGQEIDANMNLYIMSKDWTKSSFTSETPDVIDEASNTASSFVYMYSFAKDPTAVARFGLRDTYHMFNGTEQLKIKFAASPSSSLQIDVYAMVHSTLQIHPTMVKKVTL